MLVFWEPEFPEVPWQVPGGTIEPGEDPKCAACREFAEETGLPRPDDAELLGEETITPDSTTRRGQLHRFYFRVKLGHGLPDTWDHWERFASDGAAPVLFRFCWMPRTEAREKLGPGFSRYLDRLD